MSGESQRRDPFEHVAVSLVEEGGGIDRVARVYAVLPVDHKRLRGGRCGRGEGRLGSLLGRWDVSCRRSMRKNTDLPGLGSRLPAEQDTVLLAPGRSIR